MAKPRKTAEETRFEVVEVRSGGWRGPRQLGRHSLQFRLPPPASRNQKLISHFFPEASVPDFDFELEPESPDDDFVLYSNPNAFERFSITVAEFGGCFDDEDLLLSRGT